MDIIWLGAGQFNMGCLDAYGELYDLVSVMHYDAAKMEHSLAMAFGDIFELEEVKSFALADFCVRCGISRSFFARELENLCNIALEQAPLQVQSSTYVDDERDAVRRIADFVVRRAVALKAMTAQVNTPAGKLLTQLYLGHLGGKAPAQTPFYGYG